jgi:hypothetical protein
MRKKLICALLCAYIAIPMVAVPVFADNNQVQNTGTAVAGNVGTAVQTDTSTNTNVDTGTGGGTSTSVNSSSPVSSYGDLFNDMGNPLESSSAVSTSATLAPVVASIIGFFGKVIPLCIIAYTGLELACIAIPPIRGTFGAGTSGGGMEGTGNKKVLLQVSEDCLAVLKGGSGGMDGGSGGGKGEGLSAMFLKYLKLRSVTLVVCLVTIGILLTPYGYAIILKVVELIFSCITQAMTFLN